MQHNGFFRNLTLLFKLSIKPCCILQLTTTYAKLVKIRKRKEINIDVVSFYLERDKTTANKAQMTPTPSPTSTPNSMTPKQVKNHTTCEISKQNGINIFILLFENFN